jgi:hypothetical protein
MWIIHEPKTVALWNKRHFEEKNGECAACLKYSVLIFVKKIYRVSQEEGTKLREGVPYVKLYRKTPKHLYPKLNDLGNNGNWKLWTSFGSKNDSYHQLAFVSARFSARGGACERTFLRWLREVHFIQYKYWVF